MVHEYFVLLIADQIARIASDFKMDVMTIKMLGMSKDLELPMVNQKDNKNSFSLQLFQNRFPVFEN